MLRTIAHKSELLVIRTFAGLVVEKCEPHLEMLVKSCRTFRGTTLHHTLLTGKTDDKPIQVRPRMDAFE